MSDTLKEGVRHCTAHGRRLTGRFEGAATLAYFLLLGVGFMLLEMGFLQKFILYLAHPIFSAAAMISGFLVFAGLGSHVSRRWSGGGGSRRGAAVAAGAVVCLALLYILGLDGWLALTRAQSMPVRFLVAALTIAPLAFAMGHLFPMGLRQVGTAAPALVPWSWAINGSASVVATVAAPLLAVNVGFSRLALVATGCYAAAGFIFRLLPDESPQEECPVPFHPEKTPDTSTLCQTPSQVSGTFL